MGGVGSGGRRPGAGAKRRSAADPAVTGTRSRVSVPARVLSHPSVPAAPVAPALPVIDEADAPDDLTRDERLVWLELAPHAMANGTLVPATSLAFRLLCRNIVLERTASQAPLARGTADHRGLIQRVDAELLRFNLAPCGKLMAGAVPAAPAAPVNPLDRVLK